MNLLEPPKLLLMVDIESLDLGPRPVITQIAIVPYDLEQDELLKNPFVEYLPAQPQMDMSPLPRTVSFSTILWWMNQSDEARARFNENTGDDLFDVQYIMKSLVTWINKVTNDGEIPYTVVAKGPQFDIVAIESLLTELDLEIPWHYQSIEDLRTLMRRARIDAGLVPKPEGFIAHMAYWDARWQIDQYLSSRVGAVIPGVTTVDKVESIDHVKTSVFPDLDAQKKMHLERLTQDGNRG